MSAGADGYGRISRRVETHVQRVHRAAERLAVLPGRISRRVETAATHGDPRVVSLMLVESQEGLKPRAEMRVVDIYTGDVVK